MDKATVSMENNKKLPMREPMGVRVGEKRGEKMHEHEQRKRA